MPMAKHTDTEIYDMAVAEVLRRRAGLSLERDAAKDEAAAICAGRKDGHPAPLPLPPNTHAAYELAKAMLDGHAPASFTVPPLVSREDDLLIKIAAFDLALHVLSDDLIAAEAAAAVAYAQNHTDEWRALAREIILTAMRLEVLESRARDLLRPCGAGTVRMDAEPTIGRGILGIGWDRDPLREARADALATGIISKREIEKATHD
jgi:hypothetical protein